jgi:hypothetical protein
VEEVNAESSVLLHERVKHIEEKEEKLLEEVAQLKTQNGDLLQGNEALRRQTKTLEAQNNELKAKLDGTCVIFRVQYPFHDTNRIWASQGCEMTPWSGKHIKINRNWLVSGIR